MKNHGILKVKYSFQQKPVEDEFEWDGGDKIGSILASLVKKHIEPPEIVAQERGEKGKRNTHPSSVNLIENGIDDVLYFECNPGEDTGEWLKIPAIRLVDA